MAKDREEFEANTQRVIQAVNKMFKDDPYLVTKRQLLPADNLEKLFLACADGVLLCKLALMILPNGLSEKKINYEIDTAFLNERIKQRRADPNTRSVFQITQNYNLFTGCMAKVPECAGIILGSDDVLTCNFEVFVKALVILLKSVIINRVRINNHPNLVRFIQRGETVDSLTALGPEKLLIRWCNFHLLKAGSPLEVQNITTDLRDCSVLLTLFKQICNPEEVDMDAIVAALEIPPSRPERPIVVIDTVNRLGCAANVTTNELAYGEKLPMLTLLAAIFDRCPALDFPPEDETTQLEQQVRNLKMRLAEYEKSTVLSARGKNAMEEVDKLTDENQRLRERIEDLENENEFYQQKVAKLEQEKEGMKNNKFSTVEEKFKSIQDSYQAMLNDKNALVDELQNLLAAKDKELQEEKRKRLELEEDAKQKVETMLQDLAKLPEQLKQQAAAHKVKSKQSQMEQKEKERAERREQREKELSIQSLSEEAKEDKKDRKDELKKSNSIKSNLSESKKAKSSNSVNEENGSEENSRDDDDDDDDDDDGEEEKEKKKKKKKDKDRKKDKKDKKKKKDDGEEE